MTISDDNQSNLEDTDDLAAETRQLLDAATQGDWKHLPPSEGGTIHRVVRLATDDDLPFHICRMEDTGYSGRASWDQRAADAALIAAAPRLLANWLAREDELIAADGEHYEAWKRDQAKWKADRDERDAERAARERAETENGRLRALTEGDPYSIYYEAAEMRSELMHLRRWKLEATEVIESWELVYEALGDVGGLGQRRSDAVLAEVLRMKAELDRAQLRSIEARNPGIDMDEVVRTRQTCEKCDHRNRQHDHFGCCVVGCGCVAAADRGVTDGEATDG